MTAGVVVGQDAWAVIHVQVHLANPEARVLDSNLLEVTGLELFL
jgi:hypothetical protein